MSDNTQLNLNKLDTVNTSNAQNSSTVANQQLMDGPYPWRLLKVNKYEEAAGFWLRFVARLIDSLIIFIGYSVIAFIFAIFAGIVSGFDEDTVGATFMGIYLFGLYIGPFCVSPFYYALFESSNTCATPGKMALGIIVIGKHAEKINFWPAFGRTCVKNLSFMFVPFIGIAPAFTDKKQAVHDFLLPTYVVKKSALYTIYNNNYPFLAKNTVNFSNALISAQELEYIQKSNIQNNNQNQNQNQSTVTNSQSNIIV
ncbi:RDD family protein [Thorsellia anophelis]|uniref:Uncharacterized membrane protein YckC, RDD family n=1 Tax=Thorsellia anophelis DSM 18579 TaxID=1123402 RepID=A0A1I0BH64_9GAMM|nr:RDD family protein [Thorsellia anophelis]SET06255.1 Uncharacterized membrane protein YckC, RDD family [Thorsellia anophelis DSM 18579]